jgi:serine/threonine protein phosphatase PrpC
MKFAVFQISRKGGRADNQDRMGYCYNGAAALFAVADGMGGHPEGQVAAQIALQAVSSLFQQKADRGFDNPSQFLKDALDLGHREIVAYAAAKQMPEGPRTTLVLALIVNGQISWIHCGDSRLYLARDGLLYARTRDHSYAEHPELLRPGTEQLVNRNVLFTCLGSPTYPIYDLSRPLTLREGDKILLCSDGLWATVSEEEIVYELWRQPVSQAAPDLVEQALRLGGAHCDNVTVLAVSWDAELVEGDPTSVFTDSMGSEVFASTIAADMSDLIEGDDPLSLSSIEASIADINFAIRKANGMPG